MLPLPNFRTSCRWGPGTFRRPRNACNSMQVQYLIGVTTGKHGSRYRPRTSVPVALWYSEVFPLNGLLSKSYLRLHLRHDRIMLIRWIPVAQSGGRRRDTNKHTKTESDAQNRCLVSSFVPRCAYGISQLNHPGTVPTCPFHSVQ